MNWKPSCFIVYTYKLVEQIKWPDTWGLICVANLPDMLRQTLSVKSIGSEMKLIWNEHHRWRVIEDNKITHQDLEDYLKSDCSMISFKSERTMQRAAKELTDRGSTDFICVNTYRDVIVQQAYHRRNKSFQS